MSENYSKVKDYYNQKLWSIDRVKKAVGRWITKEEYERITGKAYE